MVKRNDPDEHWLSAGVNLWQLISAVIGVAAIGLTLYLANKAEVSSNESRITRLEVRSENGTRRNDTQDADIERLRAIASSNQIMIGQLNARLDSIIQQLNYIGSRLENTRKEAWGIK